MKYHLLEHESFREVLKSREEIKKTFIRQEQNLTHKKEKLFKNKDLTKWGYDGPISDFEKLHEKLLHKKESAFTYMLQKES